MYRKILIANRGEIALRITRTVREMGITSVAVYSDVDRVSRHVLEADESYRIGPAPAQQSYLDQGAILEVAKHAGCEAIHPGYGFLAENPGFAQAVADAGLTFIGPSPSSMRLMGDKIAARQAAVEAGVPVVPGSDGSVESLDVARAFIAKHGVPVLVKAGGGGGGRGIRVVEHEDDLPGALERASVEAETYFGNRQVYLERLFRNARHIEVQIVGDKQANVVAWGERDCSTQRRRQKLIEETPASGISAQERTALMDAARRLGEKANYVGAGTIEFLHTGAGEYFFLEMNTRIQVEHTITEAVTGLDLVREGIEVSCGKPAAADISPRGHAVEARINAEDPGRGFSPGAGAIAVYREPGGQGVRVDSGVYQGFVIPRHYDSLIAKLVVHAQDRGLAIAKLLQALHGFRIEGVPTTIPLAEAIAGSPTFREGLMTTDWLDAHLDEVVGFPQPLPGSEGKSTEPTDLEVEVNGKRFAVRVHEERRRATPSTGTSARTIPRISRGSVDTIVSPMHGIVMAVKCSSGDTVEEGDAIFIVEAMKMENEVPAPRSGKLTSIHVAVGDTIDVDQLLAELEPEPA